VCVCIWRSRPEKEDDAMSVFVCLCVPGQDTRSHVRDCEGGRVHTRIDNYSNTNNEQQCDSKPLQRLARARARGSLFHTLKRDLS